MNLRLQKIPQGYIPADSNSKEWSDKIKIGDVIHGDFKRERNSAFHRKFFALLNLSYEYWQPGEISSQHGTPQKNFDRFRSDLIILAGFYEVSIRIDGSTRIEPKSISFAKMDNDEFSKLYEAVLTVIIEKIMPLERKEIEDMVMSFA